MQMTIQRSLRNACARMIVVALALLSCLGAVHARAEADGMLRVKLARLGSPSVIEMTADGVIVVTFKATEMAEEAGLKGLANIICLGKLWAETHFCDRETLDAALRKNVPPKRAHLLEPNLKALQMGIDL